MENVDPTLADSFDPAVMRQAALHRKFYDAYLELGQNPGLLDGSVKAPVKGMEDLQPGGNYVPHIYDFMSFGEHVRRFGDAQMTRLLTNSIASHLPDLEDAVVSQGA